jgi:RNA polymerase sigma factor (sigma-70 family)
MGEHDWLAKRFEENRTHLRAVGYRMLGSLSEADDAVQEAWLRLSRSDTSGVDNLGGWLTTVVARVSLDMLRSRKSRREEPLGAQVSEPIVDRTGGIDPEHEAVMADSVGAALLVVLETLAPAERLAFVLHDMFDVPFDEIAPILGRSTAAARQLASRARRRIKAAAPDLDADLTRQREVVDAFLAASRDGDFDALLALLDPDVVLWADRAAVHAGALKAVRGAPAVAATFSGRARFAQPTLVNGAPGAVRDPGGQPRVVFSFTITRGKIVEIHQTTLTPAVEGADPEHTAAGPEDDNVVQPSRRVSPTAARRRSEEVAVGILTEDMKRVVKEQRLAFIATVCPDGTPNLSPKGTTAVWDDDHLIFVDIRSPGTVANLRQNPAIEINVVDQVSRKGYRFKGTAAVLTAGPVFDQVLASRRARGAENRMRALVLMKVERALPITSPAYDLGVSEDELRAHYRRYWETLWSGGDPGGGALEA